MKFERTQEMLDNMTMDAFGRDVQLDLHIQIVYEKGKLKAYSPKLKCFLQFPRKLREPYTYFVCDAVESTINARVFYRAYKGSIRDLDNNVLG